MTDIIIGQIDGRTLRFHDDDGEGDYDRGEGFSFDGAPGPLDETAAREALNRIGISSLDPGARMHRVAAYMDCLRMAERSLDSGEYTSAQAQLDEAEHLAREAGFSASGERLSALRWRAVEAAFTGNGEGFDLLRGPGFETADILHLLRSDTETGERNASAALVLDYVNACRNRDAVRARHSDGEAAFLSRLESDAERFRSNILLRACRLSAVRALGIEDSRSTQADQMNIQGIRLHIGDRVQATFTDTSLRIPPFVIDHFEIHASCIVAVGAEGQRANIDTLQPCPVSRPRVSVGAPPERRSPWILGAIRNVLSRLSF